MRDKWQKWRCTKGCGEFKSKADFIVCPKCKTRKIKWLGEDDA